MKPSSIVSKVKLITSESILDRTTVANMLGITERSADNLLQRWTSEGILFRTAPGVYMSAQAIKSEQQLILKSVQKTIGGNILLVGSSSLSKVGWCKSDILHVAVARKPSSRIPKIRNCVLYFVGAKKWLELAKSAVSVDLALPPILHPVKQMTWWMEIGSPVEMPNPARINWEAIRGEPMVAQEMKRYWADDLSPEQLESFDVERLYTMLHADRLAGTTPGRAESEASSIDGDGDGFVSR